MFQGQDGGGHLHSAAARPQMTKITLQRGYSHVAQYFPNGQRLALIVSYGAQPVRHHATHLGWSDTNVVHCPDYGLPDGYAVQSLTVACRFKSRSVAQHSGQNLRTPGLSVIFGLEHECGCPFSIDNAVPSGVEGS